MNEDDDHIVTLAFFPSEIEATMIADELKREGLQAESAGIQTAGFTETSGKVKVLVHERDLGRAKDLLDDYIKSKEQIDWSQVDIGEPEDGEASSDSGSD